MPTVNPMQILQAISDKKGDSLWPKSEDPHNDNNAGSRARVFNDVSK